MYICPIRNGLQDGAISLYSCKIVAKVQLRIVSNIGIYCSSDKVGRVYPVPYIFENSTVNSHALCNPCQDMSCCWSECILKYFNPIKQSKRTQYGTTAGKFWAPNPNSCTVKQCFSETVRNRTRVHVQFWFRMTNNMNSQNSDISSCDTLYTDGLQTIENNGTLNKRGLKKSKRACQTISPYNMYRINQLVISVQPIYRSTHSNNLQVHTEQDTGCPYLSGRQLDNCYTHCPSKHDFIKTDQKPFLSQAYSTAIVVF